MPSRTAAAKLSRPIGWTCVYRKLTRGWPRESRKELRDPPKILELDRVANEEVKRVRDMTHCQDVVCVSVLGTGIFGEEPNIIHPIVRIHTIDATTGHYLKEIKNLDALAITDEHHHCRLALLVVILGWMESISPF